VLDIDTSIVVSLSAKDQATPTWQEVFGHYPGRSAARTTPARPSRGRRTRLRIAASWPWTDSLAAAFTRLASLPRPAS
jgi:hypothetical protein